MDTQRAGILIKKINSLFNSMDLEDGSLSTIERDLMLKYIRDLYELFVDGAPADKPAKQLKKAQLKSEAPATTEAPRTYAPISKRLIPDEPKLAEPETTPPPPLSIQLEEDPKPTPRPAPRRSGDDQKIDQLFAFKEARELSEKLSLQPIRDLNTAFSINDKLLYTNELFGRQPEILNESLATLNRFESMDEARGFMLNLAEQYDWAEEERAEIARSFIKTIRRRYLA